MIYQKKLVYSALVGEIYLELEGPVLPLDAVGN